MKIDVNSSLLFIGDSITDCGRARPVGEGPKEGLGNGYVALIDALLRAACPEAHIRVMNTGISGNTVRHLASRWQTDVLDRAPDWLSIKIGINDVWRQFDSPLQPERGVPADEYEATLERLVAETRPNLRGLILMTPYYIEPNREDPMRRRMDEYGAIGKEIARRHEAILVDTQAAFDRVLESVYPMVLANDRVHPSLTGHMILARAFLEAIET